MPLHLGQLVYTSFADTGLKVLASKQVPQALEQVLLQQIVFKYWSSYKPPQLGYRAVYLYQVSSEQTLFGWFYNDQADDIGRSHLPYFICYYLAAPLLDFQLEFIFTCLHKGPLALVNRHAPPACLNTLVIPDLRYQPIRPGVAVPQNLRSHSYTCLRKQQLLDLFVAAEVRETVESNRSFRENKFHRDRLIEAHLQANLPFESPRFPKRTASCQGYKQRLQQYRQALIEATQRHYSPEGIRQLSRLQRSLNLTNEDIELIKSQIARQQKFVQTSEEKPLDSAAQKTDYVLATSHLPTVLANWSRGLPHSVFARKHVQILLGISIAATILALAGSVYGLLRTRTPPRRHTPSLSNRTNVLAKPDLSQELFRFRLANKSD